MPDAPPGDLVDQSQTLLALPTPDVDDRDTLAALGAGRISFGPFLQTALTAGAHQLLVRWL
jgi:hypothetical protein